VIKPFNVQVAIEGKGRSARLAQLGGSLAKAEEGIKKAMGNYRGDVHKACAVSSRVAQ
jgi:hypothetical protein